MKTVDYYFHIALVPPNGSLKVVLEVTFSFHGHDFFFENNFPLSHALKNPISSFFPNQISQKLSPDSCKTLARLKRAYK